MFSNILNNVQGELKVKRYWTKKQGEDVEVEEYFDDKGFHSGKLLRMKGDNFELRTGAYHSDRVVKPASLYHQTAIARDINNVKKRRG